MQVAIIKKDNKEFYTDNLEHPLAIGAVIVEMDEKRFKSIPATIESYEISQQNGTK